MSAGLAVIRKLTPRELHILRKLTLEHETQEQLAKLLPESACWARTLLGASNSRGIAFAHSGRHEVHSQVLMRSLCCAQWPIPTESRRCSMTVLAVACCSTPTGLSLGESSKSLRRHAARVSTRTCKIGRLLASMGYPFGTANVELRGLARLFARGPSRTQS